jgi:glycosyltransferase involved in cell wall biosynthesis
MRIGMMVDLYKPYISGITNHIELSKKYLEAAGHEVFVFTFGDEHYQDDEPNVIRSPGLSLPLVDTGYYLNIRYSQKAQKLLRSMDVVHVHHPFLSGRLAIWYCKPRGIPIVYTNHTRYDLYAQAYLPVLPEGMGETFLKAYLPNFCTSVDLVIAPSMGLQAVLQRIGVTAPITVLPNGVDLSPFRAKIEPVDRATLGFDARDVILIYVGRLGPEKNLPFLLRSFNGVVQTYEGVRLLIVGDGPERDNLEDRVRHMGIGEYVSFAGQVPYAMIPAYLKMADVFVTASVTEVHPLSVIEAMAAGLPVLGIDSPGISDSITNGETGYIVSEEDLAIYTAKMIRLVKEREIRLKMSKQARSASEQYAIERTTKMMVECYQQVVDKAYGRQRTLHTRWIRFWDSFQK